jgi:hypothetical protein
MNRQLQIFRNGMSMATPVSGAKGKGRGGILPSSGLPLLGSSDRQLQEEEFASPAERKKAAPG